MSTAAEAPLAVGTLVRPQKPTRKQLGAIGGDESRMQFHYGKLGIVLSVRETEPGLHVYKVYTYGRVTRFEWSRDLLVVVPRNECATSDPDLLPRLYREAGVPDPGSRSRQDITKFHIGQRVRVLAPGGVLTQEKYRPHSDLWARDFRIARIDDDNTVMLRTLAGALQHGFVHVDFLESAEPPPFSRAVTFADIRVNGIYRIKDNEPAESIRGLVCKCTQKDISDDTVRLLIPDAEDVTKQMWVHISCVERASPEEIAAYEEMEASRKAAIDKFRTAIGKRKRDE